MRASVWIHVAAGAVALLAGFVSLYTTKGSDNHRAIGRVFVYAMLAMALSGAGIAAVTGVRTSVVVGTLTAYLAFTALTAARPLSTHARWVGVVGAGVAIAVAAALAELGRRALSAPGQVVEGMPAVMAFVFAAVAALAAASDIRLVIAPPPRNRMVVRHLWRMCFALFIAAASFFLGQPQAIPRSLRSPVLVALPVLTPIVVMAFWLWRMRASPLAHTGRTPSVSAETPF